MVTGVILISCTSTPLPSPGDSTTISKSSDAETYTRVLAGCLKDGGAVVEITSAVSFSAKPGPAMSDEDMAALVGRCRSEAGPPPDRPTDPDTAERVYRQLIEVRDCLRDLGYITTQPPSLETFVDEFPITHGSWHPYIGLEIQFESAAEQLEVESACPPNVE